MTNKITLEKRQDSNFKRACCTIGEREYGNSLPCESAFSGAIYKKNKETVVFAVKNKSKAYDCVSVVTVMPGVMLSLSGAVLIAAVF